MMTELRFKWLYAAALVIGGTIVWQMGIFLLGHFLHWRPSHNLFDLCLILFRYLHVPGPVPMTMVNGLILYTIGTMAWMTVKHGYDVRKANKLVTQNIWIPTCQRSSWSVMGLGRIRFK